jgi:hypothetical protein
VFCSSIDHLVRECPSATQYIQQKKIIRDDTGRIALPDGNYVPQGVPGKNLCKQVDNYSLGTVRATRTPMIPELCGCSKQLLTPS